MKLPLHYGCVFSDLFTLALPTQCELAVSQCTSSYDVRSNSEVQSFYQSLLIQHGLWKWSDSK